jgi:antitoxin component YwqK of YwqJK toxin-antitoxin module
MKNFFLILLIFFPFLISAQINQTDANGQRQGLWKKEQSNGRPMYEGHFHNDKPVGEWKRFHEGGQVKATIKYSENSDSAFVQLFDVWGKKVAEGNYIHEKKTGTWAMFSENRKIAQEQYKNGVKHGVCLKFYDSGELLEEAEWQNGKQEGKYQVLYKSGQPYLQCKFSNNQRNGVCLSFFTNGRTEMEAFYRNSLRHDEWKYYNEKGELLYTLKYHEGKLLNPEVRDSIDYSEMQNLEKGKGSILDPEKFMQDPSEYMMKKGIYQ